MREGKDREMWWHTASIVATLMNANRKKGTRLKSPGDIHPYEMADRKRRTKTKANNKLAFGLMKSLWVDKKSPREIAEELGV